MKSRFLSMLLGMLLLLNWHSLAQSNALTVKGYVFVDKNNNGVRDQNETGLKDVRISDQSEIVLTDASGAYSLSSTAGLGNIFVIQPDGYVVKGAFWKKVVGSNPSADFAVIPAPKSTTFTFVHASDTHLSEQSLPRLVRLKAIVDSLKPAFMIVTGDLIKDALRVPEAEASRLYEMYRQEIAKFNVPVWNVPGNHEIFGIERHKSLVSETHPLYGKKMYRHYLGPDYYSFCYGGIQFTGLNSVDYHDLWYYGHIDSLQLSWIERNLALTSARTPNITFNHIPFFSGGMGMGLFTEEEPGSTLISINGKKQWRHVVGNAEEVMLAFKDHNYSVALGGHFHFEQKFTFESNAKVEFHQTGAVVGPTSEGGFSMPSGVVLYTVTDGKIRERKFIAIK